MHHSSSDDKTLRLWSAEGAPLAVLLGHESWVNSALALPEGRLLSWSDDNTLRLWSVEGKPLGALYFDAMVTGVLVLEDSRAFVGDGLGRRPTFWR